MKKVIIAVFLAAVITSAAFSQSGVIRELTGDVELRRAGSSAFVAARAGDTVELNTIISTGFRSTAVVAIGSSIITVRPLTRLSLSEIQNAANSETVNVNLQAGRVRVDVTPPAGTRANFTVQSPSATASVRGTSFEFDTINLSVDEGRVIFSGNSGPAAVVNAGSVTLISADGTAANPAEVTAAALIPTAPVGTLPPEVISPPSAENNTGSLSIDIVYQ